MKPYKTILCVDVETRWSRKPTDWCAEPYTLSTMTTEAYIRDPLFKAFGFCIHEVGSSAPVQWYSHKELPHILRMYAWETTALLAHNATFDIAILSMLYGVKPCFIFDTLSMGRALRGVEVGNSLMQLAKDYGLPPKGTAVYSTDGLYELPPEVEAELAAYCMHDVELCEALFGFFMLRVDPTTRVSAGPYPTKELRLIDMTVRMYTEPTLLLDVSMLEKALVEENVKLAAALVKAGVDEHMLASNDKFADLLRSMGIAPPIKISKTTGKEAYAFAKNDALFQALLNSDDEDVVILCEARLKVKSTLERTRAQRFIDIAGRGALPMPLSYYGAATGRWSAAKGSNINIQNMKRKSFLRSSIMAPEGHVLVVGDLSQIEPRVLAWLADYEEMLDIFRAGGDPYATFGAQMFNVPGLTKETHPLLRQSAKSALLGAGYMLSWASFASQLLVGFLGAPPLRYGKADAKQLGVTAQDISRFTTWKDNIEKMTLIPHTCTEEQLLIHCLAAKAIIEKYRKAAHPVVSLWNMLSTLIEHSLIGGAEYTHKGVLKFRKGEIEMVNGMHLRYPGIEAHKDEKGRVQYSYFNGKMHKALHCGVLANNITQGLARVVMTDGMLRTAKRYRPVLTVHDEQGVIVPETSAVEAKVWVKEQMVIPPKWLPGIPLDADVGFARRYGEAKG